jgi:L-alanine-DL-glutamate epimerase-like enolase superfamily enzyme
MCDRIDLTYEPCELVLREPLVISKGVDERVTVLRVQLTWRGTSGYGEVTPYEEEGQTLDRAAICLDRFTGELGDDPYALEAIERRLVACGAITCARAGVDAALHDLVGKLLGQPTWRLLGLQPGGPPTSYTISLGAPDAMLAQARAALERFPGLRSLKLKLGGGDGEDLERVRAVASVGPALLTVDANEAWSLAEATDLLPELARVGVRLVEQPLPAGSADGPALKARSPLPVFLDEDCFTLADVARVVPCAHGINIKLVKCGGIREALRMIHAARAVGLGVMLGSMLESGLGISPAVQISSLADAVDLDANLILAYDPAPGPVLEDGVQVAPDRPGLGVTFA